MLEVHEALAGLAPFVWHLGISGVLMALCILGAWFLPSLRIKFALVVLAFGIFVSIISYLVGVKNETSRCEAQSAIVQSDVTKAVTQATAPAPVPHKSILHPTRGLRYDKWDRDWKN